MRPYLYAFLRAPSFDPLGSTSFDWSLNVSIEIDNLNRLAADCPIGSSQQLKGFYMTWYVKPLVSITTSLGWKALIIFFKSLACTAKGLVWTVRPSTFKLTKVATCFPLPKILTRKTQQTVWS